MLLMSHIYYAASIIVYFIGLLVSFISLCIICDDYLVPSVEVFIVQFRIPEEVAGSDDMICYDSISGIDIKWS